MGRQGNFHHLPAIDMVLPQQLPPPTNQTSSHSLREGLIENWKGAEQLDNLSKRKKQDLITLYFGDGGTYNADQLENRANMYDQLESIIKLMKQNLKSLLSQVQSPEGDSIPMPAA